MNPLVAAVLIEGVLIFLLLAAGAGLYRRVRELELATYHGVGRDLSPDTPATFSSLQPGRPAVIVKLNRQCPVCDDIVAGIGGLAAATPDEHDIVLVSEDSTFSPPVPARVRVVGDPDQWRALSVPFAPALVTVNEQHQVTRTMPVGSVEQLRDAVAQLPGARLVEVGAA